MKTLAMLVIVVAGFLMGYPVVKPLVDGVSKIETSLKVK